MNDLETAVEIIGNRLANRTLTAKLADYLGGALPQFPTGDSVPVLLMPYVAGGTTAEISFAGEVGACVGRAVIASYVEDDFTITNAAKVNSWRPAIVWPDRQQTRQWIVPERLRANGAAQVGTAETIYGMTVAAYQAGLAAAALKGAGINQLPVTIDMSAWYRLQSERIGMARSAAAYYPALMAVAACSAVLYRYEAGNPLTARFRHDVVEPAITKVSDDVGVSPVIVSRPYDAAGRMTDLGGISAALAALIKKYGTIGGE